MEENNGNNNINTETGDNNNSDKKPDSSSSSSAPPPADWELLSMSMTASVSDLKSALAAAEAESEPETGNLSEAALHSQYFGQVMAKVLPRPLSDHEIFPQDEANKQIEQPVDPEPAKPDEAVGVETVSPAKCEIEQQILLSSVPVASEAEEGFYGVADVTEVKKDDGVVTSEVVAVAVSVVDSSKKKESKSAWAKRQFLLAVDKVNRSSTLWSVAFAAGLAGLIFFGRRWYNDNWRTLDVLEVEPFEEKVNELAQEIAEVVEPDLHEASEGVESQQPSSSWLGSLRDLW